MQLAHTTVGNISVYATHEPSDSQSVSPPEMKNQDTTLDSSGRMKPQTTSSNSSTSDGMAGVRTDEDNHVLLYQELEEDSQIVFASDSPSLPFLGPGSSGAAAPGGSSSRRLLSEETTTIPERCVDMKAQYNIGPSSTTIPKRRGKPSYCLLRQTYVNLTPPHTLVCTII